MKAKEKAPQKIIVNLALQGGGAQGTFTQGVLDRLNEITFNASLMREIRNLLRIQQRPEHLSKKIHLLTFVSIVFRMKNL